MEKPPVDRIPDCFWPGKCMILEHLAFREVSHWPKLAWVAVCSGDHSGVVVHHGPMVEATQDWCVEAVWAGEFGEGGFDQTDLVFGTGVRRREGEIVFVSSGTTLDRLWHVVVGGKIYVSNTLPGLLALSGVSLRSGYNGYQRDIHTIAKGLERYQRAIPGEPVDIHVTYYHNLRLRDHRLREEAKVGSNGPPHDFTAYKRFLFGAARALGDNAADERRQYPVQLRSTVSSGYDSTAAALVAREAGCLESFTIQKSNSLWRGSDSGHEIAERLGVSCSVYDRNPSPISEEAVWAASGWPGDLNLIWFDYPEPLTLLFTGFHGDRIWDRQRHDVRHSLVRGDISGLGLCEYRLSRGLFNCPVPYWGAMHAEAIQSITLADEMAPWTLGNDYDRPIPRRLLEEEGVERRMFGMRKRNTVVGSAFHWPTSADARSSFSDFLKENDVGRPADSLVPVYRRLAHTSALLVNNSVGFLTRRHYRPRLFLEAQMRAFQWANLALMARYRLRG